MGGNTRTFMPEHGPLNAPGRLDKKGKGDASDNNMDRVLPSGGPHPGPAVWADSDFVLAHLAISATIRTKKTLIEVAYGQPITETTWLEPSTVPGMEDIIARLTTSVNTFERLREWSMPYNRQPLDVADLSELANALWAFKEQVKPYITMLDAGSPAQAHYAKLHDHAVRLCKTINPRADIVSKDSHGAAH